MNGWHGSLLPTPAAHDDGKTPEAHLAMKARMGGGRKAITSLAVMAQTLLPTPNASDYKGPSAPRGRVRKSGRTRTFGDSDLPEVVTTLFPTPQARDGKGHSTPGYNQPNLPGTVETLLPTPRVSGGSTSMEMAESIKNGSHHMDLAPAIGTLLPTPVAGEARHGSPNQHRTRGDTMLTGEILGLLPDAQLTERRERLLATPQAYEGERGGPQHPAKRRAGGHMPTLQDQACFELLPTPSVADGTGGHMNRSGDRKDELLLPGTAQTIAVSWGAYEPAIRRWEEIRGIPAPSPVEPGMKGNPRLAPPFVEWMMGLPPGWVTEIEGLSRSKQLKLLGNGVVPQQVIRALLLLLEAP